MVIRTHGVIQTYRVVAESPGGREIVQTVDITIYCLRSLYKQSQSTFSVAMGEQIPSVAAVL